MEGRYAVDGAPSPEVGAYEPRPPGSRRADPATVQDLTSRVRDGLLTWTAPSGGDWILISYWQRGSGQQPESGPHSSPAARVWRPGARATQTDVVRRTLTLDALLPWPRIPELADVSGIGRYRTTLTLPPDWGAGHGALLDLGEVSDTCRVTLNGTRLGPVDRLRPVLDAGPWLRRGDNALQVEVATPLVNRLRVARPEVFGALDRQACGLTGPVRLLPYGQASLT